MITIRSVPIYRVSDGAKMLDEFETYAEAMQFAEAARAAKRQTLPTRLTATEHKAQIAQQTAETIAAEQAEKAAQAAKRAEGVAYAIECRRKEAAGMVYNVDAEGGPCWEYPASTIDKPT